MDLLRSEIMKLIWASDVHLNFLYNKEDLRNEFYTELKNAEGDVILFTGDIAESHNVVMYIEETEEKAGKPVYFVLGNHDFYGSSAASVKRSVKDLGYLGKAPYVALSASTALIGVDGW